MDNYKEKQSGLKPKLASRIQVLDESSLDRIHNTSLRILREVGVKIDHPQALKMLKAEGAEVEGNCVYLSSELVERSIQSAPAKVTLFARDPEKNIYLGEGRVHFTNGFGATWVEDPQSRQLRDATLEDLATYTRLADALEQVHYCLFSVVPQDIQPDLLDVECTAVVLTNTSKHVQLSLETADWIDEVVRIGEIVAGRGQPIPFSAGGVPNSPLHYSSSTIEKFIRLAQYNIPCFVVCGAMAGATSPVTLAGTLALQNAEVLAGVLITQLVSSGAPVIYGTFSGGFDMRSTKLALGGPEVSLIAAASQQLCERYGIPLGYATGGVSDSSLMDIQTGQEKTRSVLFAASAGVDVVHDAASGLLGAGMVASQAGMVVDADECQMIAYLLTGIDVSDESLAFQVIADVGPGGTFLDQMHTAKNFRRTLAVSPLRKHFASKPERLFDRSELIKNAHRKAAEILSSHQVLPLSDEQIELIEGIRSVARQKVFERIHK
jgi:trimethylamine--corrinoid protein Co-methyltransferase